MHFKLGGGVWGFGAQKRFRVSCGVKGVKFRVIGFALAQNPHEGFLLRCLHVP